MPRTTGDTECVCSIASSLSTHNVSMPPCVAQCRQHSYHLVGLLKSIRAGKLLDTTNYRIKGDVDHQEHDASLKSALARSQGVSHDLYLSKQK